MTDFRIGIVGSRRRNTLTDRAHVFSIVAEIIEKERKRGDNARRLVIVSGGCPKGADRFAEEAARANELTMVVHRIERDPPIESKREFCKRAFARNELVARDSDELYALVSTDRTGGTENTVDHSLRLGRSVYLIDDSGRAYLSPEDGMRKTWPPEICRLASSSDDSKGF